MIGMPYTINSNFIENTIYLFHSILVHWIVNAGPYNFYMESMHMEELLVNNSWEIHTCIHEEFKDQ
jgi:hypothetical protein